MEKLEGIFPPLPTPFDAKGSILLDKLEQNLGILVDKPVAGIMSPGSFSEAAYLKYEERLKIWRKCVDVLETVDKVFIAGTGVETTQESILLTKEAADIGAQAALVLPPFYYKPQMNHEVLLRHYADVADSSPIDIILYNVPEFTGLEFQLETLLELADHPKIVGIKDSSANLLRMSCLAANRPNFKMLCGVGVFLPYLSIGSKGGIMALSNIAPEPLYQILEDYLAGRVEKARERQWNLVEINMAITTTYGVPGLKYAMENLGLYGGVPRRPLLPLSREGRKRIDSLISVSGLKTLN